MGIVLDASTALAAVLPDQDSTFARSAVAVATREGLIVPALWPYEVQNGLASAFRRKRIDANSLGEALDALRGLAATLVVPQQLGHELHLAAAHGLSTYDAAYMAVAIERGLLLATNDERLRRAAEKAGVALFNEH